MTELPPLSRFQGARKVAVKRLDNKYSSIAVDANAIAAASKNIPESMTSRRSSAVANYNDGVPVRDMEAFVLDIAFSAAGLCCFQETTPQTFARHNVCERHGCIIESQS